MSFKIGQFKTQVNDLKEERPRYKEYADVLEEVLRLAARQCCPLAIVQSRVKSVASYAEKIIRPGKHYDDPLKQITDLCGARVVTAIKGEAEAICRFIRAYFDIDEANSLDAVSRLHTTVSPCGTGLTRS